jgi:methyl-accepting chemotaxis protein
MGRATISAISQVPDTVSSGWVTGAEKLSVDAPMLDAVTLLRAAPGLRMIALVDEDDRPCGALYERELRSLLFSPFGYALLCNRSLAMGVRGSLRPCPTVEIGAPASAALDAWADHRGAEGLLLTRGGRFVGVVDQQALLRIAAGRDAAVGAQRAARADRIDRASRAFEQGARALATGLSDASTTVAEASLRMAERAQRIGDYTAEVAAASAQAADSMAEIAERGRGFAGSLDAVGHRMAQAQEATHDAVVQADRGAAQVVDLAEAADSIGSVSDLIDDIARQTTMLALNASMEAARAGPAGRGFTTVAHAVKELADQTRVAAAGISGHVQRIRGAIDQVSLGQSGVTAAVGAVEALSSSVMQAIREQGAAGRTISANVADASIATDHIGRNVTTILDGARSADTDANVMHGLAATLADKADQLDRHLAKFLRELEAA